MVNPMDEPALTLAASATLVMWMSAQLTWIELLEESEPSFEVVTLAVLLTVPHVAEVVGEVICTVSEPPLVIVPMLQVNTPAVIEQVPAAVPPSTDQLVPAFVGNVAITLAPVPVSARRS